MESYREPASASAEKADDERGFNTAGRDHPLPMFGSPPSLSPSTRKSTKTSAKASRLKSLPLPVISISPEDLDLDKTVVAGEAFVGSSSDGAESFGETLGPLTSYSRAVTRGRLDASQSLATSNTYMRGRKQSILKNVMSRLRTSSASSLGVDDFDTRSLTSAKALKKDLLTEELCVDIDTGVVLFAIMEKKYPKERKRAKLLAALLTYSDVNINERAPSGMAAMHCAMHCYDLESAKILVAFGANINATNHNGKTPLDMLQSDLNRTLSISSSSPSPSPPPGSPPDSLATPSSPEHGTSKAKAKPSPRQALARQKCIEFLKSIGGLSNEYVRKTPSVEPFPQVPTSSPALAHRKVYTEALDWEAQITSHYSNLERNIQSRLGNHSAAGREAVLSADTAISLATQLREMTMFQKAGSRVLCLDGGGIRGLIELEVLSQLEAKTGRRITELFDWIVGTSTGGILALGLVYAKKSLVQLRQLYFRMREEVFRKSKGSMSFNTVGLEQILKKMFTETQCMDDETYPRVLISAVKKDHINLKLHFFNNCFNDDYHKHWPVWKVARYTCAAPVLFGESDDYVDGGLLANNPSDSALSKIQSFHRSRNEKIPISLVVSVGSGKYPFQALGNVDFLFVGGQGWSSLSGTSNLFALLSYALVEPSVADENCRSRCEEQGIRYFRLNPRLEEVIDSGETDMETLVSAILQTRKEMENRREFSNLVLCLHELSDISRRMHNQLNGEDSSNSSNDSSVSSII